MPPKQVGGIRAGSVYKPLATGVATLNRLVVDVAMNEETFDPLKVTYRPVLTSGKLGRERSCQWQTFVNWAGPEETDQKVLDQIDKKE